ncbi:TPA: recombinase family protein [Bacillus cereus]|nr:MULTISPECIES: recombinase family protein [Bacillus]MED2680682.1 recombinase family protein [Bacillus thuringiensis]EKS7862084.1 recombinase family protein [Bacillus cereus]MBL3740209.1 recombinase family protein [Bacillus cereus]MBL3862834.1 recombinase family protein [Bacillus cereus]MCC2463232.1 recombinase family protein [Bacillus mobilis]
MNQKKYQRIEDVIKTGSKAAFYARYSTDQQDESMQVHSAKNVLEEYGCEWQEDNKYIDQKTSAVKNTAEQREEFQRLIRDARKKKFDFIISYKSDRIARNTKEHYEFRREMNKLGIPVILSSTKEIYTEGEIVPQTVKDALTQIEPAITAERTRDTFESKVERGEWIGGEAPYGYSYDKSTGDFIMIEKEKRVVVEIFRLFKLGYGLQQITDKLSSGQWDVTQKWYKDKIKYIITNPFYSGYLTMNRYSKGKLNVNMSDWTWSEKQESIQMFMPREEWEFCFRLYLQRRESHTVRKINTPFWLRDILFCEECQSPFRTKNQRTTNKRKSGEKIKYGKMIYECKKCKLKLEMETIHEKFKIHMVPIIKNTLEKHREDFIQKTKRNIEEECESISQTQQELENTQMKLLNNIYKLDVKISQLYEDVMTGKMEIDKSMEDQKDIDTQDEQVENPNNKLIEMLLTGRSKKYSELEDGKRQQEMLKEKLKKLKNSIYVLENGVQDEIFHFSLEEEQIQSVRNFLLQFLQGVYVRKDLSLRYEVYENLIH